MSETLGRILGHARKYSFRKAERKFQVSSSSVVTIHNLKSSRDDGILYPDDQLNDVADDREQIIAVFDESSSPLPVCSDVTSTSSVCTASPDLFSVEVGSHCSNGPDDLLEVAPLQVRRGSEPALNCLFPSSNDPNKRWSTAVVIQATESNGQQDDHGQQNGTEECTSPVEILEMNGDSKMSSLSFSRGSGRLSILGNNSDTYRWLEAADRQLKKDFNENFTPKVLPLEDGISDTSSLSDEREKTIILKNESGPLGIHVVPDSDSNGRDNGLVIQGIEAGGGIDRDGRFHVGDRITEINGRSLQNVSFQQAQEIFKNALRSTQICLELVRGPGYLQGKKTVAAVPRKPPAPIYPKTERHLDEEAALVEGEERGGISTKVATVTPCKKVPASATRRLASANTRKIGKMLTIELTKSGSGLGFSITTRDNPAGGNSPIYIKNILPQGAAIEDGRLLPGDRLLEVNGIPMTGKSQTDAVAILRNISLGKSVHLVVSRQDVEDIEAGEPESISQSSTMKDIEEEGGIFPWKQREILTFQIPLPDPQPRGLGVSVKGKSSSAPPVDLGIFIKALVPGGAAHKDGRLQVNDQLVNINGISLLGMSNSNAMETLRHAMMQPDGPIQNAIILTIARRIFQVANGSEKVDANGTCDPVDKEKTSQMSKPLDLDSLNMNNPGLPGCNPVIERLMGQQLIEKITNSNDIYGYSRYDRRGSALDDKNKSPCSSVIISNKGETVLIEGEYNTSLKKSSDSLLPNEDSNNQNILPAGSQISLDENNTGFARDGFGRQSMSEKRHAQLDARNTDTYQRNKKAKEDRDKQDVNRKNDSVLGRGSSKFNTESVGPSLGLRKSSSLESLQTMLQELNKDDQEAARRVLQTNTSRSCRSRGCNESFRAAVDRSYDAPAATMETLDEESESGSHILSRSIELLEASSHSMNLEQEDLLSNKHPKKKGLLRGLGSVFKFGKNRKQSQDFKIKDDDASDTDLYHLSTQPKEHDRLIESSMVTDMTRRQLPQIPREPVLNIETIPNRQERMRSLREQHQRLHQQRQGQYPQEQKEELYENELKEKEGNYALPCDIIHGRSHSLDIFKENTHAKVPFSGDPGRYSHYMNYKEIQQHMHPRPLLPTLHPPKSDGTVPSYAYEYPHSKRPQTINQSLDVISNSLPRGSHVSDLSVPHTTTKPYFSHELQSSYGRMSAHQFYPSNHKVYSHIVPGSKV